MDYIIIWLGSNIYYNKDRRVFIYYNKNRRVFIYLYISCHAFSNFNGRAVPRIVDTALNI